MLRPHTVSRPCSLPRSLNRGFMIGSIHDLIHTRNHCMAQVAQSSVPPMQILDPINAQNHCMIISGRSFSTNLLPEGCPSPAEEVHAVSSVRTAIPTM